MQPVAIAPAQIVAAMTGADAWARQAPVLRRQRDCADDGRADPARERGRHQWISPTESARNGGIRRPARGRAQSQATAQQRHAEITRRLDVAGAQQCDAAEADQRARDLRPPDSLVKHQQTNRHDDQRAGVRDERRDAGWQQTERQRGQTARAGVAEHPERDQRAGRRAQLAAQQGPAPSPAPGAVSTTQAHTGRSRASCTEVSSDSANLTVGCTEPHTSVATTRTAYSRGTQYPRSQLTSLRPHSTPPSSTVHRTAATRRVKKPACTAAPNVCSPPTLAACRGQMTCVHCCSPAISSNPSTSKS